MRIAPQWHVAASVVLRRAMASVRLRLNPLPYSGVCVERVSLTLWQSRPLDPHGEAPMHKTVVVRKPIKNVFPLEPQLLPYLMPSSQLGRNLKESTSERPVIH